MAASDALGDVGLTGGFVTPSSSTVRASPALTVSLLKNAGRGVLGLVQAERWPLVVLSVTMRSC